MRETGQVDRLEEMFSSSPPRPSSSAGSWPKRVAASLSVLAVLAAVLFLVRTADGMRPRDYTAEQASRAPVTFTIPRGAGLTRVSQLLDEAGIVASQDAFANAAAAASAPVSLQPGVYSLPQRASAQQVLAALSDPANRVIVRLPIPEGLRATEVAERVHQALGIPSDSFMEAVRTADLPAWVPAGAGAEGLLFPATYEFTGLEQADEVVSAMVDRFDAEARALDLEARAKKQHRTVWDIVRLASLVQAEVSPGDYGKAARTLTNRLDASRPLQLDTTVNYALGTKEVSLSASQLATDSPYNTYRNKGLPPTPIDNPGSQALAAAAAPPAGDWMYFITVNLDTGETKFTASAEQFLKFKRQLARHLAGR